ncbi:hypothetical protein [Rubrivirga sp.]|uniref:hypothetical protein n=1 Tax=Rubrivirga sp. TaxID=1885344 RepID=UPI003B526DCA
MRRLALVLALTTAAHAQPAEATLTPGAGVRVPMASGFGETWRTRAGPSARVEAPAYGGRARAEVWAAAYDAPDEAVPEFTLVVPTLGWGPAVDVGPVRLGGGVRVGAARFQIDDDQAGNLQNETELAVGAWAGGALRLGRVEVWAEVDGTRLTLAEPVTLVAATGGLAVRLDAPRWLRTLAR